VVENSISSNAFRPGDIYKSRKGLTVQIDNTDAEGRLILADALAYADEEEPDLLIDMATLTGAARVALGPDLPPFFTDDDGPCAGPDGGEPGDRRSAVATAALQAGYEKDIRAKVRRYHQRALGGMAGAITAALFLKRFVSKTTSWAHFDIYGWAPSERPHSPGGGEAQAIRALYHIREISAQSVR
jgi:leucyl aminopeptidase